MTSEVTNRRLPSWTAAVSLQGLALGLALGLASGLVLGACGSDSTDSSGGTGSENNPSTAAGDVDWNAWDIVYTPMYSAFIEGSSQVFSLPAYVDQVATEPDDWTADPPTAVTFSPWTSEDESQKGVLINVVGYAPEVTLRAANGGVGGEATLFITQATEAEWEAGKDRYINGETLDIAMLRQNPELFSMVDFSNGMPMFTGTAADAGLETNLRCDNCHTEGATMFQVQHTPTQAARFSDEDLINIFTMGMKPAGVGFRVLPAFLQGFYEFMHTWQVDQDQARGLVVYLRSLAPKGQGDILLPTGMLAAPDIDFSTLPPPCNPTGGMFDPATCREMLPPVCRRGTDTYDREACEAETGIMLPSFGGGAPGAGMGMDGAGAAGAGGME